MMMVFVLERGAQKAESLEAAIAGSRHSSLSSPTVANVCNGIAELGVNRHLPRVRDRTNN